MNTSKKVGNAVSVMRISAEGKIIRIESGDIGQVGRNLQGFRLVRMDDVDRIAAASVVPGSPNLQGVGTATRLRLPSSSPRIPLGAGLPEIPVFSEFSEI